MKNKVIKHILTFLPQNSISRTIGKLASSSKSKVFIKPYARFFDVDVKEAKKQMNEFSSLTDFFTRELKKETRSIHSGKNVLVSPVDGTVSEVGIIEKGCLIQAKGISYTTEALLGCSALEAKKYDGGHFITIYLSPKDYHRIHMPLDGKLLSYTYIPGRLFPVNKIGVSEVKGLFTKNERLITYTKTNAGELALVKVGAFIVGSVDVPYASITSNKKKAEYKRAEINHQPHYKKGDEVGLFKFGSTVILLFEKDSISFSEKIKQGKTLKMGEEMAKID